jgi:hypothetical protein
MSLKVDHIDKSFGQVQAIADLSMEVEERALGVICRKSAGSIPGWRSSHPTLFRYTPGVCRTCVVKPHAPYANQPVAYQRPARNTY